MISEAQDFISIRLDSYELFQSNLMRSEVFLERLAHRADKVHSLLLEAVEAPQPSEVEEEARLDAVEGRWSRSGYPEGQTSQPDRAASRPRARRTAADPGEDPRDSGAGAREHSRKGEFDLGHDCRGEVELQPHDCRVGVVLPGQGKRPGRDAQRHAAPAGPDPRQHAARPAGEHEGHTLRSRAHDRAIAG
jgi:hypothetical protein